MYNSVSTASRFAPKSDIDFGAPAYGRLDFSAPSTREHVPVRSNNVMTSEHTSGDATQQTDACELTFERASRFTWRFRRHTLGLDKTFFFEEGGGSNRRNSHGPGPPRTGRPAGRRRDSRR